jgi:hypothetical protein
MFMLLLDCGVGDGLRAGDAGAVGERGLKGSQAMLDGHSN